LTIDQQQLQTILESAHNPSPQLTNLRRTWQQKDPQEKVQAARKLLYGVVEPTFADADLSPDVIETVEAIFEACFEDVSQSSQRSRSRSGSQMAS